MTHEDLFAIIDPVLRPIGSAPDVGEDFDEPPLEVIRYYLRPVRLHWVPWLGQASSLVAVVRQPIDVGLINGGYSRLLRRVAMAANGRYPPWRRGRGLVIGLTTLVLTAEPIGPDEDSALQKALIGLTRMRTVPLGLIRLNLGQEAFSFALARGPDNLFPEPEALADALTPRLRRYVPFLDM